MHLLLGVDGCLHLDAAAPPRRGHRPSADELFRSCARAFPAATAGVLLTGMGSDGAEGLAELRRAGGVTVVQDEASSVVFGMPRAALECGAADIAMPPREIGEALARMMRGTSR
jgi:two-component system, chemotaxis family, protein-glutamate methylesterase/glutaminase